MKVITVFGTRPEAIKMAPVILTLRETLGIVSRVCVTAQHRTLLDQVLLFFGIEPDFDLDLMTSQQSLETLTAGVLAGVSNLLRAEQPDLVLVQGDTTTAFASALASFYQGVECAHVEAGLRTWNPKAPWPEEINRKLISSLACAHFAPTESARKNLIKEGIAADTIFVTGNTGIDALRHAVQTIKTDVKIRTEIEEKLSWDPSKKLILVTCHRRETFITSGISQICDAIERLAERDDVQILFPIHPNPNVRSVVESKLAKKKNISLVAPLTYPEFIYVMHRSYLILTDSGGIQEEAPSLNIPVIVLREITERPEAVDIGAAILAGTTSERILRVATGLLDDELKYRAMIGKKNPFGDGMAAARIVDWCHRKAESRT